MLNFTIQEAAKATGAVYDGAENDRFDRLTLDSREAGPKMAFLAVKGENFDGHDYIEKALEQGAVCAFSQRPEDRGKARILFVPDTVQALCDLAHAHRMKFDLPLVGVTGSVGKTTTKEMIACVLETKYHVLKTEANHNNQIGMPRTLLELSSTDTAAVMEMGSQGPGDIRQLTNAARPQVAVITKIGVSHLEQFKTRENILRGKLEIAEGLSADGTLILNQDDVYLRSAIPEMKKKHKLLCFAVDDQSAEVHAKEISGGAFSQSFILCHGALELPVFLPVGGLHNVYDALAAYCVGFCLGTDPKKSVFALGRYEPSGMRQKVTEQAGRTLIEDCYNASPDSMEAALGILSRSGGSCKIAVLGDMLELGALSDEAHKKVGVYAAEQQIDLLLTLGRESKNTAEGAKTTANSRTRTMWFADRAALLDALTEAAVPGSVILFKGSRGMHLEELIAGLKERLGG